MKAALLALAAFMPAAGFSQTTMTGDAWISGKAGIGVAPSSARFEVQATSATEASLQVSGVDETPFLLVDKSGSVALSTTPAASLDVWGIADSSDTGIQLQGGALYPSTTGYQVLFGYAGQPSCRHAWRSKHSTATADSSLDFLLWTPAQSASAIGSLEALSLATSTSGAAVHVRPVAGTVGMELVVSDGSTVGGGTVHRLGEATHSSIRLKRDVRHLGVDAEQAAYDEAREVRPVRFRYRGSRERRLRRGLLFEDAPEAIRGPGGSISVDGRVVSLELAAKELIRRLESSEAALAEGGPK